MLRSLYMALLQKRPWGWCMCASNHRSFLQKSHVKETNRSHSIETGKDRQMLRCWVVMDLAKSRKKESWGTHTSAPSLLRAPTHWACLHQSLSLYFLLFLSHTHTRTVRVFVHLSRSLFLSLSHTHTHTLTHSLTHASTHTHSVCPRQSQSVSVCLCLSLSIYAGPFLSLWDGYD